MENFRGGSNCWNGITLDVGNYRTRGEVVVEKYRNQWMEIFEEVKYVFLFGTRLKLRDSNHLRGK